MSSVSDIKLIRTDFLFFFFYLKRFISSPLTKFTMIDFMLRINERIYKKTLNTMKDPKGDQKIFKTETRGCHALERSRSPGATIDLGIQEG